jgi:poly(U)-specific endoribonuclease
MNPSYSNYGGHSPYGQAYNPSMHHNAPPAYSPYGGQSYGGQSYGGHQSFGQPSYAQPSYSQPAYVQPAIAQAPALTVLQPSRPGIGQLAKEALVYSSVSAGVSAAVNRLLPGGIYGRSPGSSNGGSGGGGHTEITYNNYYYNQSNPANGEAANNNGASSSATPVQSSPPAPVAPADTDKKVEANAPSNAASTDNTNSQLPPQNNNPSQPNYPISNDEVKKLSESLFGVDNNNVYKYITVNLQGETKEDATTDDASLP